MEGVSFSISANFILWESTVTIHFHIIFIPFQFWSRVTYVHGLNSSERNNLTGMCDSRPVRVDLPDTTQVNFTLQFSDTAFDFTVVSKDGCISSVS